MISIFFRASLESEISTSDGMLIQLAVPFIFQLATISLVISGQVFYGVLAWEICSVSKFFFDAKKSVVFSNSI